MVHRRVEIDAGAIAVRATARANVPHALSSHTLPLSHTVSQSPHMGRVAPHVEALVPHFKNGSSQTIPHSPSMQLGEPFSRASGSGCRIPAAVVDVARNVETHVAARNEPLLARGSAQDGSRAGGGRHSRGPCETVSQLPQWVRVLGDDDAFVRRTPSRPSMHEGGGVGPPPFLRHSFVSWSQT
jgi:hypothetical protein